MAWTSVNPVAVGNITKKSQYDAIWDNADYLHATVLGSPNSNSNAVTVAFRSGVTQSTTVDNGFVKLEAAGTAGDGASIVLYGEDHASTGYISMVSGGDGIAESGGGFLLSNRSTAGTTGTNLLELDYQYLTLYEGTGGTPIIIRHHDAAGYLALYGGSGGATGAQLVLQGDDYSGVGLGGAIALRTGTDNVILFEEAGGTNRLSFDISAGQVAMNVTDGGSSWYGLTINSAAGAVTINDPVSNETLDLFADDTGQAATSKIATDQTTLRLDATWVQIPTQSAGADPSTANAYAGAMVFDTNDKKLYIFDGTNWLATAALS